MPKPAIRQGKPHIPFTPDAIERPRLLAELEAGLERKLTLVSAPPGYGKTIVVSQLAQRVARPVAWHTVEERERDIPHLYHHARHVLAGIDPSIEALPSSTGYPSHELAALIANHLRQTLSEPILYVIDDAHHLDGAPAAESWLRTLAALLPAACHLIVISRTIPDIPFIEMLARGEVYTVGQDQLRFTEEDAVELAAGLPDCRLSQDEIARLTARLDGWPAGVHLALQPLPADLGPLILGAGAGPEALFEQLAAPMLKAQLPGLRDFLLAASTLERLTPERCDQILDLTDSADWLTTAWSNHLFLSQTRGEFVFHTLFRNFLQKQLQDSDPHLFAQLHVQAGRWFEERDEVELAFRHYLAAGEYAQAVELAERVSLAYYGQGRFETLLQWNQQLAAVQVQAAWLSYTCAIIHADRYEYDAAEAELDKAAGQVGVGVQIQQALIDLQRGHYEQVIARTEQLEHLPAEAAHLRGRALRAIGFAHLRLGNVEEAVHYLEEAVRLYRLGGDASNLSHVLQDLQVAYTRLGRLDEAGTCLQEIVALRRSLGGSGALALALNNLGYYYHQRSDYEQAMTTFQQGLSVIAQIQDRRTESYLRWSLGDLLRDLGQFEGALEVYNRALQLISRDGDPSLICAILVSAAVLKRWQAKYQQAVAMAQEALALAERYNIAFEKALAGANLWTAQAYLTDPEQALASLLLILEEIDQQGARFEMLGVLAMCAQASLLCDDQAAALRYITDASRIGQEIGSSQLLAAEIAHSHTLETLIADHRLAQTGLLAEDLRRLYRAQSATRTRITVDEASLLLSDEAHNLRVLTLGQEVIIRNGQPVPTASWRGAISREVFFYLLFQGPQSREALSLIYWPDSDEKQIRDNFHSTLYQARQALGKEVIVFEGGRYLLNPGLDVWCDAQELEKLVHRARLLPPRDARTEDLWIKALALYQGDFLLSIDADWVLALRERMLSYHIETLVGLGGCAQSRRDGQTAIDYFKQALAIDPFREDIHRSIMTCYAIDLGQKKQALDHFEHLQAMLRLELGIRPSNETLTLARTLLD